MDLVNNTKLGSKKWLWLICVLVTILILLLCILFLKNRERIFVRLNINRSIYYKKRNLPKKAIKELLKAYKISPDSPEIIYGMMDNYFLLNDFEKAGIFARKLLTLDRENKKALWMLGILSLSEGKEEDTFRYFEKLYSLFESRDEYIKIFCLLYLIMS